MLQTNESRKRIYYLFRQEFKAHGFTTTQWKNDDCSGIASNESVCITFTVNDQVSAQMVSLPKEALDNVLRQFANVKYLGLKRCTDNLPTTPFIKTIIILWGGGLRHALFSERRRLR